MRHVTPTACTKCKEQYCQHPDDTFRVTALAEQTPFKAMEMLTEGFFDFEFLGANSCAI